MVAARTRPSAAHDPASSIAFCACFFNGQLRWHYEPGNFSFHPPFKLANKDACGVDAALVHFTSGAFAVAFALRCGSYQGRRQPR